MKIEVLYFADLKDITGKDKENFTINTNNLNEVLNLLFEKYHSFKDIMWIEKYSSLRENISVAINDCIIHKKEKLSIELSDGDRIAFLLPVSGG